MVSQQQQQQQQQTQVIRTVTQQQQQVRVVQPSQAQRVTVVRHQTVRQAGAWVAPPTQPARTGATKWLGTPNEEARVYDHFKSHLKWPNTQQGSEWHFQGVSGHFMLDLITWRCRVFDHFRSNLKWLGGPCLPTSLHRVAMGPVVMWRCLCC